MPKKIDHVRKKQEIAEAAWSVILQNGLEGATVRTIAEEADISVGALRYYFPTQDNLMEYAYSLIQEKISENVGKVFQRDLSPKEKVMEILLSLLPDGEGGRSEIEVRMAFTSHPLNKKHFDKDKDAVYAAVRNVMSNLMWSNLLKKDADLNFETERLYALIEGMAINSMRNFEKKETAKSKKLLFYHLLSICQEQFREMQ
ncbi:TetR/AcrR family transcriptional regulator [Planococcus salinus]|uniref:TetR family transcriptional regulator n=1 Tax=Planococcus salinus TaxID=1848460 RepID=A0A3M8PDM7_9BACL|nr:TetR family transcriptional regulator C-terminal domain-containing protein [Planococcus salinus]RNF41251.1 TetR family transcriptional regulator [Planococcus salinus]